MKTDRPSFIINKTQKGGTSPPSIIEIKKIDKKLYSFLSPLINKLKKEKGNGSKR